MTGRVCPIWLYHTFQRNGSHRFSVHYVLNNKFKDDDLVWWIDIRGCGWWYNEKHKMWYHDDEALPISSSCAHYRGNINKRKLARMIKRWNLPKGTQVLFKGDYKRHIQKQFIVTIRWVRLPFVISLTQESLLPWKEMYVAFVAGKDASA